MTEQQLYWLLMALVTDEDWPILFEAYYRPRTDTATLHMLAARYGVEYDSTI